MRKMIFDLWCLIPLGRLLRFQYGGLLVTLRKDLWVEVSDDGGKSKDALPLTFVSQQLIDEIELRLASRYGLEDKA